jgi:hypothetical protein
MTAAIHCVISFPPMKRVSLDAYFTPVVKKKPRVDALLNHWHSLPAELRAMVRLLLSDAPGYWALAASSRLDWVERNRVKPLHMGSWVHSQSLLSLGEARTGMVVQDVGSRHIELVLSLISRGRPVPALHARRYGYITRVCDAMYVDVHWTHFTAEASDSSSSAVTMPVVELSVPHGPSGLVNDIARGVIMVDVRSLL